MALIIGMSEYQHLSSLANPVPDAKAIAASLRAHGFEVSEQYNLTRADLLDVLEAFKREAEGAQVETRRAPGRARPASPLQQVGRIDQLIEILGSGSLSSSLARSFHPACEVLRFAPLGAPFLITIRA